MNSRKISAPSPTEFADATEYFTAFFKLNKDDNPFFSHRSFAARIKWPNSFLSDIMSGRRHLTVARSLQFAGYFQMSGLDQERMLWLALAQSKNQEEKKFFEKKLNLIAEAPLGEDLCTCNSGLVAISRSQIMAIAIKIIELRNWAVECSQNNMKESEDLAADFVLMQLDLNLFPVKKAI